MQIRSRTVEMPSGLSWPLAFGMNTRLIGSGRYVSCLSASASSASHRSTPYASMSAKSWPSIPGAPFGRQKSLVAPVRLEFTCRQCQKLSYLASVVTATQMGNAELSSLSATLHAEYNGLEASSRNPRTEGGAHG